MSPSRQLLPVLTALAVVLAGCGDDATSSDGNLGDFQPGVVIAEMDGLLRPLQATATTAAIINLEAAYPSLEAHGIELDTVSGETAVEIPESLLGTTFTYDRLNAAWTPDPGRTDAPSDAVRVIWYELSGAGEIGGPPIVEQGFIDLREEDVAGLPGLDVRAVDTSGSPVALLDFEQGYDATAGGVTRVRFSVEGLYGDGTRQVDFSIDSERVRETATGDEVETVSVVLQDASTYYELQGEGKLNGETEATQDVISQSITISGVTTVVEVTVEGADGGADVVETTGSVTHDGELVATITAGDNGVLRFSDAEGNAITGGDAALLRTLYQTLQYGLAVVELLPLYFR